MISKLAASKKIDLEAAWKQRREQHKFSGAKTWRPNAGRCNAIAGNGTALFRK